MHRITLVGVLLVTAVEITDMAAAAGQEFVPVTDAMLRNPDPEDWLMWRRTLDSWGYSPLDQITRGNVQRLEMVWSVDLDPGPSQEGIPLVYDGVLYYPGPMDVIWAMDAANGDMIWEYSARYRKMSACSFLFPKLTAAWPSTAI